MNFIANKIFVDRENHKTLLKKHLKDLTEKEHKKILSFYGAGGQGKSSLCDEFKTKILTNSNENIVTAHHDFDLPDHQSPVDCMESIRKNLGKQLGKKFIAFDIAFIKYKAQTTNLDFVKFRYKYMFRFENALINDSVDVINEFASEVPGIKFVFNRLKNWGHNFYLEHLKSSEDILNYYNIDSLDAQKILALLPVFLASDINRILLEKGKKLVLTIDTYEKLWEKTSSKTGYGADVRDKWLRDIFQNIEKGILIIVFGRDKLRWDSFSENELEPHYVGRLSDQDCDTFLQNVPIKEKAIRNRIIKSSEGLPFYLDLQADLYQKIVNSDVELKIEKFGQTKDDVFNRFFNHIGDHEKDNLTILAVPVRINKEIFLRLRKNGLISKSRKFEDMMNHSFFQKPEDPESGYLMHGIMRSRLVEDLKNNDIDLYLEVNECMFDFYEEKIRPIINRDSHHEQIEIWVQMSITHLLNFDLRQATSWLLDFYPYAIKNYMLELAENIFRKTLDKIQSGENYIKDFIDCICNLQYFIVQIFIKRGKFWIAEFTAKMLYSNYQLAKQTTVLPEFLKFSFSKTNLDSTYVNTLIYQNKYDEAKQFNINNVFGPLRAYYHYRITNKMQQVDISQSIAWNLYFQKEEKKIDWNDSLIYNILGNAHYKAGKVEMSKLFYHNSLKFSNKDDKIEQAVNFWCLGKAYSNTDLNLSNKYLKDCIGIYHQVLRLDHPYYLQARCLLLWNDIIEEGIENIETHRIRSLFTELFTENPYEPWLYDFILIVAQQIHASDPITADLIIRLCVESLTFKYGQNFKSLIPFIEYCKENNIELHKPKEDWINIINKLNEYKVRTYTFSKLDILDEKCVNIKKLLETHHIISNNDGRINYFSLPFYFKNILIEIEFSDHSIFALSDGHDIHFITSFEDFFSQKLSDDLCWNPNDIKEYVRFYFDSVLTSSGRLFIIEEIEDLKWNPDIFEISSLPKQVLDLIKPLEFTDETEDRIRFHSSSVINDDKIYKADIDVSRSGQVTIDNVEFIANTNVNFEIVFPDSTSNLSIVKFTENVLLQSDFSEDSTQLIKEALTQIKSSFEELSIIAQTPLSIRRMEYEPIPDNFRNKILNKFDGNNKVDAFRLIFCNHHKLIRVLNNDGNSVRFFITDFGEVTLPLDWTSNSFHKLVKEDFIFNEETAGDYLRLFTDFLKGIMNTRFSILEDSNLFTFLPLDGDDSKVQEAKSLIKPIRLISKNNDHFIFESNSMLNFNSNLSYVKMKVNSDGTVEMLKDRVLLEDILILPNQFEKDIKNIQDNFKKIEDVIQSEETLHFNSEHSWLPKLFIKNAMDEMKQQIDNIYEQ